MALTFLPEGDVVPIFECLQRQATTTPKLQTLIEYRYVSRTWIHTSTWPPSTWSILNRLVHTNDIEGWHNRLNKRAAGRCNLPFYLLIALLHKEARITAGNVRLVSEKKLRSIHRKRHLLLQAKIFSAWDA